MRRRPTARIFRLVIAIMRGRGWSFPLVALFAFGPLTRAIALALMIIDVVLTGWVHRRRDHPSLTSEPTDVVARAQPQSHPHGRKCGVGCPGRGDAVPPGHRFSSHPAQGAHGPHRSGAPPSSSILDLHSFTGE